MSVSSVAIEVIAPSANNQPQRLEPKQSVAREVNEVRDRPNAPSPAGKGRGIKVDFVV